MSNDQLSVRERVKQIQLALRDQAVTPQLAREANMQLTALLGNVNDVLRAADVAYKRVLLDAFSREEKANRAKIAAETSPEYAAMREAKDVREIVIEMIRSCRAFMRSLDEEMRLQR